MARQRLELKEAETRYSQLFSTVPVGLFRAKPNGEFREVNPALIEMLGYPDRESLLKVNAQELFVQGRAYESFHHAIEHEGVLHRFETQLRTHDGRICWAEIHARAVRDPASNQVYYEGSLEDITERKQAEEEREKLISELQEALAKIKTLSGLLPICSSCKKIRDDKGYWNQIEVYIESHSDAEFTHSFCPDCMRRLYPEISEELAK
jgi:PAS domain S-box-containing protein